MLPKIKSYYINTDVMQIEQVQQKTNWKLLEQFFQYVSVLAEQTIELEKSGGFCYDLWRLVLIEYTLTWTAAFHCYECFILPTSQRAIA